MHMLSSALLKARRILLLLGACVIVLCALASCKSSPTGERIDVRFWCGFTGPDGRHILKLIKRFNKENPEINVTLQRIDWPQYYNKLFVAGLADRAPEVFVIHSSSVERFWQSNLLRPVDDLASGTLPLDLSDFSPNIWESVVRKDRPYGIPLDVHMMGMYYNRKLFREAGIVDATGEPKPPKTRDEFMDAVRRITKDTNGDGTPEQYGYVFTWMRTNGLSAMEQWQGQFFSNDLTKATLTDPRNVEALQFLTDLIHKHKVAPEPYGDAFLAFLQGRVGIAFEGVYMLEEIKRQKDLDFGTAPVPVLGTVPATWGDSHVMCLSTDMDEKHTAAAWKLIKFLSDNSLDWAASGQVPVRKSLLESERFKSMTEQRILAQQIDYVKYVPRVPFIFEFLSAFDVLVEQALRGTKSPLDALKWGDEEVNRNIVRMQKNRAAKNEQ